MRDKIIERLASILDPRDRGRFDSVFQLMFMFETGLYRVQETLDARQKKIFNTWDPSSFNFDGVDDDELLALYELAVRRASIQR